MRSIKSYDPGTEYAQLFGYLSKTGYESQADEVDRELMNASIKRRNETELTYRLKWSAWRWLYEQAGCRVVGFEVRLEGPSGRIAAAFAAELAGTVSGEAAELARQSGEAMEARRKSAEYRLATFSTKFHDMAYLRAADFHYLMAPHGLVWPSELPPFWGLLNESGEQVIAAPPKQVRRVTAHVLRSIGKSNTRDLMKVCGEHIASPGKPASAIEPATPN